MSPNGFVPCQVFEPRRSPTLCRVIAASHTLAAVAALVAQLSWPLKLAVGLALGLSAHRAWTHHATRSALRAVVRLERRDDGRWRAQRRDGTAVVGELVGDSFIDRRLVIVGIADGWHTTFTPVPADALRADDHRRLRVWVKWQPDRGAKSAAPT